MKSDIGIKQKFYSICSLFLELCYFCQTFARSGRLNLQISLLFFNGFRLCVHSVIGVITATTVKERQQLTELTTAVYRACTFFPGLTVL